MVGRRVRAGLTLLELVVVIAIMGILVALLVVSLQGARETARRTMCVSHLQQMAYGVAQYEATYNVFPAGLSVYGSLHLSILPYIGDDAAYEQIVADRKSGLFHDQLDLPTMSLFLCPSDGAVRRPRGRASTNYAGNTTTWFPRDGWNGLFHTFDVGFVSTGDITDGLSNTTALSEMLRASGNPERLRVMWNTPTPFTNIDVFAHTCASIPDKPASFGWHGDKLAHGTPWSDGNIGVTLFTHVLTPNHPSCYDGTNVSSAASTAASFHPGGVNVAFADGHIKFISQTVSPEVWRSHGSRR